MQTHFGSLPFVQTGSFYTATQTDAQGRKITVEDKGVSVQTPNTVTLTIEGPEGVVFKLETWSRDAVEDCLIFYRSGNLEAIKKHFPGAAINRLN